jgi:hypothetical protein
VGSGAHAGHPPAQAGLRGAALIVSPSTHQLRGGDCA